MKNIVLIIAGGVGARMGQDIPKQFINVYDKPVIVYTLEAFQKHPSIDAIEVVCLDGWHDVLWAYAKQFGIAKLENIVSGGKNGQDSIRNGLYDIASRHNGSDDIVLVHDAIRPMVSNDIISDNIRVCRQYGNAITVVPCTAAHKEALKKGITNSVASCTMYIELGRKLYMSACSEKNLKLTTAEDIEIFKALLNAKKDVWMH